jgi:hypothetical protein
LTTIVTAKEIAIVSKMTNDNARKAMQKLHKETYKKDRQAFNEIQKRSNGEAVSIAKQLQDKCRDLING